MKKVSISFFGMLAIILATASAFTSNSSKMIDLKWAELDTYVNAGSFTEGVYDASYKDVNQYLTPITDPALLGCRTGNPEQVCALQIDLDANGVAGFQNADFPADIPSQIRYHDVP